MMEQLRKLFADLLLATANATVIINNPIHLRKITNYADKVHAQQNEPNERKVRNLGLRCYLIITNHFTIHDNLIIH